MKFIDDGYNWIVRLDKGEKLIESLASVAKNHKIDGAWIMALGACTKVELGFYDLKNKQYKWRTFNEELEILSLQGNIAWENDEPILHIHGTFSNDNMQAIGGHVKELVVGGTCEIFLHKWDAKKLNRSLNEPTGLKLLDL